MDLAARMASPPSPPKAPPMQLAPPLAPADAAGADPNNMSRGTSASGASENSEGRRDRPPVPNTVPLVDPSHLNPYHSTLPDMQPPTIMTPLRAHYLKKTLVNLQIAHELSVITDPVLGANALGLLGPPFALPEEAKQLVAARIGREAIPSVYTTGDLPFMRYMFHQFMLPFPFLASAPPTFWSHKVQPFLSSFLATTGAAQHATKTPQELEIAESLMTKEEKKEAEEKKKLWAKMEKHLGLMIGVGIKLVGGEEVVRIGQSELRRIEQAQEEKRRRYAEKHAAEGHPPPMISFDVNVVGVRTIVPKSRVRHKTHEVSHTSRVLMLTSHRSSLSELSAQVWLMSSCLAVTEISDVSLRSSAFSSPISSSRTPRRKTRVQRTCLRRRNTAATARTTRYA